MAFKDTKFICMDNTGVKLCKCIQVYKTKTIKPGSIILVTLKKVLKNRKIRKGQLYKAVVVRLSKINMRFFGIFTKYANNGVILSKKNELVPLGTRIFGSVFFEIRLKGYLKIISLSAFIL